VGSSPTACIMVPVLRRRAALKGVNLRVRILKARKSI